MPKFPLKKPPTTKGGYGKINRKRAQKHLKEIEAHSAAIGRVLFEWNQLHVELAMLFAAVLPHATGLVLQAIWHSQGGDSGQRRMLLDAAHPRFWDAPTHYKRIRWIVQMTDKMSTYRNIAAHMAMEVHDDSVTGKAFLLPDDISARRANVLRALLIDRPTVKKKFWVTLADDIYVLQQYARAVFFATAAPHEPTPLPRKPRLLSLQEIRHLDNLTKTTMKRPLWRGLRRASQQKSST